MFTRSKVIMLTNKHTDRRRWKHPTLFATLRHWVTRHTHTHLTSVEKSQTGKKRSFSLPKEHRITVFGDNNFNVFVAETATYSRGLWAADWTSCGLWSTADTSLDDDPLTLLTKQDRAWLCTCLCLFDHIRSRQCHEFHLWAFNLTIRPARLHKNCKFDEIFPKQFMNDRVHKLLRCMHCLDSHPDNWKI